MCPPRKLGSQVRVVHPCRTGSWLDCCPQGPGPDTPDLDGGHIRNDIGPQHRGQPPGTCECATRPQLTLPKPKSRRGCMMGNLHIGEAQQDLQVLERHTRPNRQSLILGGTVSVKPHPAWIEKKVCSLEKQLSCQTLKYSPQAFECYITHAKKKQEENRWCNCGIHFYWVSYHHQQKFGFNT